MHNEQDRFDESAWMHALNRQFREAHGRGAASPAELRRFVLHIPTINVIVEQEDKNAAALYGFPFPDEVVLEDEANG